MLKGGDTVYGPYGEMALPVIDPEDIAAVAEKVLTEPGHVGKIYELTGPQALTTPEQVATLGRVLGRRLAYVNVPDEVARKSIVEKGMVPAYAEAMIGLIKMLRELGRIDPTPTVADLLGRAATSFESFVQANASAFR
jgi:(4-alkanoyl-5-oxo-2,5-dihydrofuran-3-yl)methyl phosphate reductase